jgi:hypothetical protein
MVAMKDIRQNWADRQARLIQEIDLVKAAIERRADNDSEKTSQASREWLEKLCKWRDDLEELLRKFSDEKMG